MNLLLKVPRVVLTSLVGLIITLSGALSNPVAAGDGGPCDFVTDAQGGQLLFSHDRVMDCFNSVPLRVEDQAQMTEILEKARNRSSLRSVYQDYYDWRGHLEDLALANYSSDFAFQHAVVMDHVRHENGHYTYLPPRCYQSMLAAVMPLGLGSMIHQGKQIIYVDGIPGLPQTMLDAYEADLGISLSSLVGMKLDLINGMEPLDYFREQANTVLSRDMSDGTVLNSILTDQRYHIRSMLGGFPTQSEDVIELSSKSGASKLTLSLPWKFAEIEKLGGNNSLPLSDSTVAFVDSCFEPNPLLANLNGQLSQDELRDLGYRDHEEEVRKDAELRTKLTQNMRYTDVPASRGGFYEVKPGQRYKGAVEIGSGPSFVAYQHKKKATIIKTFNFVGNWSEQMLEFTEHACKNSDYLVMDLTENSGGSVFAMEWLASHLDPQPEDALPRAFIRGILPDIDYEQDFLITLPVILDVFLGIPQNECPPTGFGVQPGCHRDAETGEPFQDVSWMSNVHLEYRGGFEEWVTRPHYVPAVAGTWQHPAPPISCPGKFGRENLIMLVDGTNASAGYFFPSMMDDVSTSVAIGGFVGEPITLGSARGGTVVSVNQVSNDLIFGLSQGVPFSSEILLFDRNVDSRYERIGGYQADLETLHAVEAVQPDIRLPLWSSTSQAMTRGFIYTSLLEALK